jgi:hypothetical protein
VPDDVLLFRYSALTFNGHRIHYDRRYVTEVEGCPGLIVHGPLLATLLLDLLRRNAPGADVATFRFRAVRPTFGLRPGLRPPRPRARLALPLGRPACYGAKVIRRELGDWTFPALSVARTLIV